MKSAVHALGPAGFGSCPLAPVARTQRPRVAKSVLAGSPGTQVGSVIRKVLGGLGGGKRRCAKVRVVV